MTDYALITLVSRFFWYCAIDVNVIFQDVLDQMTADLLP